MYDHYTIDVNLEKDWTLPMGVPINEVTPRCLTFESVVVDKLEDGDQQ